VERHASSAATVPTLRGSARRQARQVSGGLMAFGGAAVALVIVAVLIVLDYRLGQAPHRLVKLALGMAVVGAVSLRPRFGAFVLPLGIPFLDWLPRIPVLNAANLLVFGAFAGWIFSRALAGQPAVRGGRLGPVLGVFIGVTVLGLIRGAAAPVIADYPVGFAALVLFRGTMPFLLYFMGASMLRGTRDRRWMSAMLVLALVAEAGVTIALGQNGWGGTRAVGSFGQPNNLGAYLALFTCVAAAMLVGTRSWLGRLGLAAAVGAGLVAIVLTMSRGAFLSVAAGLVFVALRSSRVTALLLLIAFATSPLWVPQSVKDRVNSTQREEEGSGEVVLDKSNQTRLNAWQLALDVSKEHLIEGVGYAGLAWYLQEYRANAGRTDIAGSAHNTYLRMLGEMGVFGLLAFLWLLWKCMKLSLEGVRRAANRADRQLAVALGAATLSLAISCAFGDRFFEITNTGNFWMLCALVQNQVLEARERPA